MLYRPTALRLLLATAMAAGVVVALAGPAVADVRISVPDTRLQTCPSAPVTPAPAACKQLVGNGTATVVDATPSTLGPSALGHSYLRLSTPGSSDKATVYGVAQGGVVLGREQERANVRWKVSAIRTQ